MDSDHSHDLPPRPPVTLGATGNVPLATGETPAPRRVEPRGSAGAEGLLWARYQASLSDFVNRPRPSWTGFSAWLSSRVRTERGGFVDRDLKDRLLLAAAADPGTPTRALLAMAEAGSWRPTPGQPTVAGTALAHLIPRWRSGEWTPTAGEVMGLLDQAGAAWRLGREILLACQGQPLPIAGDDPAYLVSARGRAAVLDEPAAWPVAARVRVGLAVRSGELQRAATSPDRWIRLGVAENGAASHLLAGLSHDPDPLVGRRAAVRRLTAKGEGTLPPSDDAVTDRTGVAVPTEPETWFESQLGPGVSAMTTRTRVAIAAHRATPPDLLAILARDSAEEVRLALRVNTSTPAEVQALLGPDLAALVRMDTIHPLTPHDRLWELARSDEAGVRVRVGGCQAAPPGLLEALGRDSAQSVRRAVARNATAPAESLERLARDLDYWVREAVAENPAAPATALRLLASDAERWVRKSLAVNPAAPVDVLRHLAADPSENVRVQVARREDVPQHLLERLSRDTGVWVRRAVAGNRTSGELLLTALLDDPDTDVRRAVAGRDDLPPAMLARLLADPGWGVRAAVAGSEATPLLILTSLATEGDYSVGPTAIRTLVRLAAREAGNHGSSAALLGELASHKEGLVRAEVARNPATPVAVLETLAFDRDGAVQAAVASTPRLSGRVLAKMARRVDAPDSVRGALARNPATPPEALAALVTRPLDDHSFARGSEACVHVAANPRTPPEVLIELIDHPDGGWVLEDDRSTEFRGNAVRVALARNPASPPEVVQRLAELEVGEILERPDLTAANLVALSATRKASKSGAVAALLARILSADITVDPDLVEGLLTAGGDGRRLLEILLADPGMSLESVAAAAASGVASKAVLNVPGPTGGSLAETGAVAAVLANPQLASETVRLRSAACASPAALRTAARSADPVLRWGAAASPRAGLLLAELSTDPDPRVSGLALQRIARALVR